MSTNFERSPQDAEARALLVSGDLDSSATTTAATTRPAVETPLTLASLPVGARLVLRCRKDWRVATVSVIEPTCVRLSVVSPTGHTYRLRRPHDAMLTFEGAIPLLGEVTPSGWRAALARYDARW